MKRISFLMLVVILTLVMPQFASALSSRTVLDDNQIEQIRNNCSITQATLSRVHISDALIRVNLGRQYEALSTKLMAPFNSRAALNKLDATNLVGTTTKYENALNNFRTEYQAYEQTVSKALQIDCKNNPASFHETVAEAQEKRKRVSSSVAELNKLIAEYRTNFNQFAKGVSNGQ